MIESLFIAVFLVAFILMIISIQEKSLVYSILDAVFWLYLMANALHIEVGDDVYVEYGFSALCLALVAINILWAILQAFDFKGRKVTP